MRIISAIIARILYVCGVVCIASIAVAGTIKLVLWCLKAIGITN